MKHVTCDEYLTYEIIETAFKIIPDAFSIDEKKRHNELHDKVFGCLYQCFHEIFIIRLVTTYKRTFPKNRVEETAEDAFVEALQSFKKYVAANGLYQKAQVKSIFYEFCRRIFLNKLRRINKDPTGPIAPTGGADDDLPDNDSGGSLGEGDFYCLSQFLNQPNNRDADIIVWRHFEKLTPLQIADRLNTSGSKKPEANRAHFGAILIYRAMGKLRKFMHTCKQNRS